MLLLDEIGIETPIKADVIPNHILSTMHGRATQEP
jgi:hypothetical protein